LYGELGVKMEEYENKMMCAGGIQGYKKGSPAIEKILEPTIKCAMRKECIEPEGAQTSNHRFDQSVFSIHIAKNNLQCQTDPKYWANRGNNRSVQHPQGITEDETKTNNVILFSRRGWGIEYDHETKFGGYSKYLKSKK